MTSAGTRGAPSGFTLIETSVALLVTGLAVAVGYAGLSVLADARSRASSANEEVIRAANVRATLGGWLRSAVLLVEADDRSAGGRPLHGISFVTADAGPLRPGAHRVALRVDLDPATAERGLVADLDPLDGGGRETLELAPNATGLHVDYRVRRDGRRRWTTRWQEEEQLPDAVRLRLLETRAFRLGPGPRRGDDRALPPLLRRAVTVALTLGRT